MGERASHLDERIQYGGQAVVEGVMMRSPRFFAVACRRLSDNSIVVREEPVESSIHGLGWLKKPFLRGTLALIDAMSLGIRALQYSANVQLEDEQAKSPQAAEAVAEETLAADAVAMAMGEGAPSASKPKPASGTINGIAIGVTTVLALLLGFGLFWTLPAVITDALLPQHLSHHGIGRIGVNLFEGAIRLIIFFAYITLISRMKHVQRVFEYHGAEHKAINTLESGLAVTLANARAASRIHPRCGTNFIFIVLITAIFVFSLIPRHSLHDGGIFVLQSVFLRLLLLPVVAGISFEILKWAGSNRDKRWAQTLIAPGLWTQYLTTRVPNDSQIEVAIAALVRVWDVEHAGKPNAANIAEEPTSALA